MSIASELSTLAANKAAIKAAIEAKNPATPPTGDMSQWPTAIASIPEGGGGLTGYTLTIYGSKDLYLDEGGIAVLFADGTIGVHETYFYLSSVAPLVFNNVVGYHLISRNGAPYGNWVALSGDTTITVQALCLLRGTMVALSNGGEKPIEDIGYGDELRVWDFERGRPASAKPLWIKRRETVPYAFVNRFSSGRVLRTTGRSATGWGHRGFNVTRGSFTNFPSSVGDTFVIADGVDELVECRKVEGEFEFYNVITEGHFNLFADGVLTSCRLNNYRGFSGRDLRFAAPPTVYHPASDFAGIPEAYVRGLHLCEQPASPEELRSYVGRLLATEVTP